VKAVRPHPAKMTSQEKLKMKNEAAKVTALLQGRIVKTVWRHRPGEIAIEFEDGARLFVDSATALDLSITDGRTRQAP
jgi:hypothetical protein